jgi:hypothetical protein
MSCFTLVDVPLVAALSPIILVFLFFYAAIAT